MHGFQVIPEQCITHRFKIFRRGHDIDRTVIIGDHIFCAGIQRRLHDGIFIGAGIETDDTLFTEEIGDRSCGAQIAAILGKAMAHLGGGAVAIIGHAVGDDGSAARSVSLVANLFIVAVLIAAGSLFHRPVDGVLRHVGSFCLIDGKTQTRIAVDITAAGARRHGDLPDHLGPDFTALLVVCGFLVLDVGPFTVSSHVMPLF